MSMNFPHLSLFVVGMSAAVSQTATANGAHPPRRRRTRGAQTANRPLRLTVGYVQIAGGWRYRRLGHHVLVVIFTSFIPGEDLLDPIERARFLQRNLHLVLDFFVPESHLFQLILFLFKWLLNVVSVFPFFHQLFNLRYRVHVILEIVYDFQQFLLYFVLVHLEVTGQGSLLRYWMTVFVSLVFFRLRWVRFGEGVHVVCSWFGIFTRLVFLN